MRPSALPVRLLSLALAVPSAAQIVNPAESRGSGQEEVPAEGPRLHSWERQTTVVRGERESLLREEDRIGPYGQPRWTATRLFPTTRIYVRPPGQIELEQWTRVKVPRDEGKTTVETQYEFEIGLPHRFQLDLYLVHEKSGSEGELDVSEQKYEVRYALADWGELWANPTLYFEYVQRNQADDVIEAKLLFADEITTGWHWGSNLVLEHELGGDRENVWELTAGVARTVIDEKLSLGAELKGALVDTRQDRGDFDQELEVGPSMRWRPLPAVHVDVAPLVGIGGDSRAADIYVVFGVEL